MGIKFLWDTNTVIYFLQQQFPANAESFVDEIVRDYKVIISSITEIELYSWKAASEDDMKVIHAFIDHSTVIELERDIKIKTAEIRKKHNLKLPDAIIAATAMAYDLTLVTRNTKDFANIDGLELINPFER
ncbi:type II toxin-antitoxin system VapC family toxin [Dyadobacter chenwenxiniae]|uniref:Type II toxin-antitoxin system VapC family toxin n=1 Tax=Dyadobacter chenwenxiniae TaxID=2906456 RepID=A0A9X1PII9_9BACT|nr:type II toxin-antitoxin system VapC family toxin [Dyadobacter chenwenxiniae]MCF0060965.1 type II toxin-antitoxin system VapC family toxin [Dyadobacter chenwenxiniae]UON80793.1 type II toxin-antitoxin system VapC family toxin [Dyadobacter chenwenxiniae]